MQDKIFPTACWQELTYHGDQGGMRSEQSKINAGWLAGLRNGED